MGSEDIEKLLEKARFKHLSEATLGSFRDKQLDKIGLALADAHLKLCLICDRKLALLQGEAEARESYQVTKEDHAANEQFVRGLKKARSIRSYIQNEIERISSYLTNLSRAWILVHSREAVRGATRGNVKWRYASKDGLLKGWSILETDHSLTVHFSSTELKWDGIRIRFRLGPFVKVVTLEREGDLTVTAKVNIPRRSLARKMADISIEVLRDD